MSAKKQTEKPSKPKSTSPGNSVDSGNKFSSVTFAIMVALIAICASSSYYIWTLVSETNLSPAEIAAKMPKGANAEGKPREVTPGCVDRHKQCRDFARNKACEETPGWMVVNCPESCQTCHLRDPNIRCNRSSLDMITEPVYQPGDMHKMFSTLKQKFGNQFDINVISEDPWLVTFENFLTEKEMAALIKTVKRWERSTDVGTTNEIGETGRVLSTGRTSSNSWCDKDCESHPNVKTILKKIETITTVPTANYETFQVLRYELGQKYDTHHDYGAGDIKLACGPRILTFFLYLSDVEEGGETAFPLLNITVKPKKGRALLWPSTLDHNPELIDSRTMHAAMPVIKGRKLAANSWLHLYNYEEPNKWGCTGTFDDLTDV